MKRAISLILSLVMIFGITAGVDFSVYANSYNNGDIIELGYYPQTEVKDTDLIESLNSQELWWGSYDYYIGTGIVGWMEKSDYMQYVDLEYNGSKYRGVKFSQYRPNKTYLKSASTASSQDNNGYYVNEVYWFKYEPIQWQVVDVEQGKLISVKAIDSQAFSDKQYSETIEIQGNKTTHYYMDRPYSTYANNYAYSSLRTWLKSNLLITAFNRCERNNLLTDIPNWPYNGNDKISIPYGFEWNAYTNVTDEIRKTTGTDYAKCQGLSVSKDAESLGNVYWWVNREGPKDNLMEVVTPNGEINEGQDVSRTNYGIRPVIYIDLTKINSDSIHNIVDDHSVESTCSQEGKTAGTHCDDCGKVFTPQIPIPKKEHDYFNSYTSSATCTEKGLKKYTCSKCRIEKLEEIPAKGHNEIIDNAKAATCTRTGLTEGSHCSVCKKIIIEQEVIPSNGHTSTIVKGKSPTCISTGLTDGARCSVCDSIIEAQQVIEKTPHTIVIDLEKSADCCSSGLTQGSHCSVCNTVIEEQNIIPIIEHKYKTTVVQATSTQQGYTTYTCSSCGNTYNADYFDAATVYSDFSDATAGSTIRVPVSIKNNTGILGWKLTFDYDKDVLTPISVDYGDVISGGIQDNIEGDMIPGSINVYWAGSGNEDYNGVMIYINFAVNQSAAGNTKIDISYSPEDTFDDDFNDVYLDCQPININITNNNYSQFAKINARADDVIAGDDVQLKLNISEINKVSNVNLTVDYNADNFEFKTVTANGVTVKDSNSNGNIALDISGVSSNVNNTDFVVLTFKAKDKAMSGQYDFTVSSDDEGIICKGCSANIKPSATSEIAEIYADGVTAKYNDKIDIPVYIENNHGIMGYRLDFKYDAAVLEPISVICPTEFSKNGQFNDSIGVKDGEFKVLWNNVDEKLHNGILMTLKFKVLTDVTTNTVISMDYNQPDTFNEKYEDVIFNCSDINVSLNSVHYHLFELTEIIEPTCEFAGYKIYTCECGESYTEEIVRLDHNYYISNTVESTCTKQGYTEYTCSRCKDTYKDNYTSVLNHNYNNGVVTIQPSCETDGVKTFTCTVCGDTYTEKVSKLNHDYNVIVNAPTCTDKGYTTYTCSRCGNSYIDNEVSASGHSYGQWTYNGNAEFVSSSNYKNGTQTRTCAVCGEEETVEAPNTALLRRRGTSLTLESSILMNVMVGKEQVDYYDEVYIEAVRSTSLGELTETITDFDKFNNSFYKFVYHGVSPQGMNDDIKFIVYGIKDGVKYWGPEYHYSVAAYIQDSFKTTKSENLKTLLADLVYYGYQYQLYTNYNTDEPLTNILTEEQLAYRTKNNLSLENIGTSTYETISNPVVRTGISLRIDSNVSMILTLANISSTTPVDLYKTKVKVVKDNGAAVYYSYKDNPEMFAVNGNYLNFYYDGVEAKEASKPVYFTVVDENDNAISNTRRYSIESYCCTQLATTTSNNQNLRNLCDALMRYCNSAQKYFANPNV
ncbi:MAG: cohesin domain-containing protein [Clostridium sp.]|nr:cohesin domain-containing protein [Clostridium sp.]